MDFIAAIADDHNVPQSHLLVQYLRRKTQAADRGSKARRSLGNLYALYVITEDFLAGRTSRFTDLLGRMKAMPFGAKLQNHPLDNRLNDEFSRQMDVNGAMLPVIASTVNGQKSRVISRDLLASGGADPINTAKFVIAVIQHYVDLISKKQTNVIEEIEEINDIDALMAFFEEAFLPNSDARLFEIASYVVLHHHYKSASVWIGDSKESVKEVSLELFRAGRTNANDGGIDFVLKPLGRIFQVTETLDFRKYFLDFEKLNRYPITFVVKTEAEKSEVKKRIESDALKNNISTDIITMYMSLFEEVITVMDLRGMASNFELDLLPSIRNELSVQFKLEYGLFD